MALVQDLRGEQFCFDIQNKYKQSIGKRREKMDIKELEKMMLDNRLEPGLPLELDNTMEEIGLDSMDLMTLSYSIEDKFGKRIRFVKDDTIEKILGLINE